MVREFGYEYNATLDEALLSRVQWRGSNEKMWGAYCLRSGRDALKVIAREYPNATALLPALCCDSMVTPFEQYGCKVCFYPLNEHLTVDFVAVSQMLASVSGQALLLYYDYFGIPMFVPEQLSALKKQHKSLVLIKDITHNPPTMMGMEPGADYTVASLRKWTNIPDGGLLWTSRELSDSNFAEDADFAKQRLQAQCLRTEFFATGNQSVKTNYRAIFSHVSSLLDQDKTPVQMTMYAYELASKTNWETVREIRKENADVLRAIFSRSEKIKILDSGNSDLYVPILIENRDEIQTRLSAEGIFNTVIWPLRQSQTDVCKVSAYVVEHMLAVPCDQRYTQEDMRYIGEEIVRTIDA